MSRLRASRRRPLHTQRRPGPASISRKARSPGRATLREGSGQAMAAARAPSQGSVPARRVAAIEPARFGDQRRLHPSSEPPNACHSVRGASRAPKPARKAASITTSPRVAGARRRAVGNTGPPFGRVMWAAGMRAIRPAAYPANRAPIRRASRGASPSSRAPPGRSRLGSLRKARARSAGRTCCHAPLSRMRSNARSSRRVVGWAGN